MTFIKKWIIQIGLPLCFFAALAGCSSAPTITDSKVVSPAAEKIRSLEFIYHQVAMKTTRSHYGQGTLATDDMGLEDFGRLLVAEAPSAFASNHVAVVEAKLMGIGQQLDARSLPKGAGDTPIPILVVEPRHGYRRSNGHANIGGFVFEAELINPQTRQTLWTASIDTQVWKGQDFLMKNIHGDVYDQSYADQFLAQLLTKLKEDGIVE